ncbi:MAG: hypothetical protein QM730_24910 [Anaerolineales bacterium]
MKKFPWFEAILVIVVMSISLYAALSDAQNFSLRWFTRDDAYYYFKVAQNISEGHGSTFDGINPTNGYHPLWMIVCIPIFALARFDLVLPLRILLLVMSGLSVTTGILLYRLLGKIFAPFIGALAALYWVFDMHVQNSFYRQGLESGIAAFFIALLIYKLYEFETTWRKDGVSRTQLLTLGLIAALTMFSRLDLVFLAVIAGVWILFRGHSLRYYLPLDILSIITSVLLAFTIKFGFPDYFEHANAAAIMIVVALIIRLPLAYFWGLCQNQSIEKPLETLKKLGLFTLASSVVIGGLMLILARVLHFNAMPRTIFLMDAAFSLLFIGVTRFIHKDLHTVFAQATSESPLTTIKKYWKQWLTEGIFYYGVIAGLLVVYMAWNKLAIGTFSPVSGQIKRWWGSFLVSFYGKYPQSVLNFFGLNSEKDGSAWMPIDGIIAKGADRLAFLNLSKDLRYLIAALAAALFIYLILRFYKQKALSIIVTSGLLPLFVGCALQVIYYNYTGYSAEKEWYWVGEQLAILVAVSLIIGILSRMISASQFKSVVTWGLVAVMGLFLSLNFWEKTSGPMQYNRWGPEIPFDDSIPLIEANTEPGSIIGMTGGGTTAYFIHDRTIVNMDGLINSKPYFEALQNRTAGEYLEAMGLDYVFANRYILSSQPYKGMFDPYLTDTGIEYDGRDLMKFGK